MADWNVLYITCGIWMQMAFIGSYVWMICIQLVDVFEKDEISSKKCVTRGGP